MFVSSVPEFKGSFFAISAAFEILVPMTIPPSPPPDDPDPALGRVIRQLREEQGVSRAGLADRSGVDETSLGQIEDGELDPPWATVEALAAGLGASLKTIATAVIEQKPKAP
jgi:DNA-binding XRE family transcriptional regulator